MNKRVIGIILSAITATILFFTLTKPNTASLTPSNHVFGKGKSGITLVEFGDFQCPACGAFFPVVKALKEKYEQDIYFQFRHFPLKSIHPNALAGARAAEAASLQGKFWEMHDSLFQGQSEWSSLGNPTSVFERYASALGLNLTKYKADYASKAVNDIITADEKEAQKLDATSTPTFVLDGKKIEENPRDQEAFDKLIADAITAKTGKPPTAAKSTDKSDDKLPAATPAN